MENQKEGSNWGLAVASVGILILYWQLNKLLFYPFKDRCNVLGFFVVLFVNLCLVYWGITLTPEIAKLNIPGYQAMYVAFAVYVISFVLMELIRGQFSDYKKNEN